MDLAAFLADYPADTDLKLQEWHSEAEDVVRCVLRTSPWWVDRSKRGQDNGQLVIRCTGVAESEIRLGWRASEVEDLEVVNEDPLLWPYGQHATIYGNAPLPDPDLFFLEFTDLVEYHLLVNRNATSYLGGVSFSEWRRRVTEHTTYHLIEGPAPLMVKCKSLLDQQYAVYNLVLGPERPARPMRLVWIGESLIICEGATVEATPALRHSA